MSQELVRMRRLALALAVGAAVAAFGVAPLAAQEQASDATAAGEAAADAAEGEDDEEAAERIPEGAEEITVTARKREENVQEVPVAVTVQSGEQLEDAQATDISQLATEVPNLAIYSGRNQNTTLTAFLRGVGQADPLWGVDPGVGLYFDDVYIARANGALLDVFDVERIEVLRGPQGTLYGKNTIGGAIKYVSSPLPDEATARVALTFGNYGTQELRASVGGAAMGGALRAKVAVASMTRDGYGENLFLGTDTSDKDALAYRAAVEWRASDRFRLNFSYDHSEDDAQPKGHTRLAANPACVTLTGQACPPLGDIFDTQSGLTPLNSTDSDGASLHAEYEINDRWTLRSITAWRETETANGIDFDTTPLPIVDVNAWYYDDQKSEELQLVYHGGGRFSGVFGAYYFDGEAGGLVQNKFFINSLRINSYNTTDGFTETESIALFGDGSYAVNDRLTVDFGLRATREKKRGVALNSTYLDPNFTQFFRFEANYDQEKTFDSVAPKLGLDYRFSDDVMGYFTASRGFKSGGFNVRAQTRLLPRTGEPIEDEILDVYELGVKSTLLDYQLTLNTAVFYGDYQDIQVSTFTGYDSNNDGIEESFLGDLANSGSATLTGLEVEYDFRPSTIGWLGFNGYASYLDTDIDRLDLNRNGIPDTQVITNAPEWTAALNANFNFAVLGGAMNGSVGAAYRGDAILTTEAEAANQPLPPISQDAYTLFDAYLSWLSPSATWRLGIAGKNLTDEEYLTNGYQIVSLGILQGSYGNPRTVTATIEYRF